MTQKVGNYFSGTIILTNSFQRICRPNPQNQQKKGYQLYDSSALCALGSSSDKLLCKHQAFAMRTLEINLTAGGLFLNGGPARLPSTRITLTNCLKFLGFMNGEHLTDWGLQPKNTRAHYQTMGSNLR